MKRIVGLVLIGLLVVLPAWLLATDAGLAVALRLAGRLTDGRLTIEDVEGRLLGDLTVHGLTFRSDGAEVWIERADLNLRLARLVLGRVQAERLDVQSLVITLHDTPLSAEPERQPLRVATPLRLAVEDGHLADFQLRRAGAPPLWVLPEAWFGARWRDEWIVIGALRADTAEAGRVELRGRIAIEDDLLKLEDVEIAGPGAISAAGAVALAGTAKSELKVAWTDLRSPRADLVPWLDSPHGELTLAGPWQDYAWQTVAHLHGRGITGDLVARGRGAAQALTLQRGELRALGGTVRGDGRLTWAPATRIELDLHWDGIDPGTVAADWRGRLNGSATLHARWRGSVPALKFSAELRDSELRGYPLALQASGQTEDDKVFLRELALASGASTLRASGQLLPEMALTGTLSSTDLRSLWAGIGGRAEARASLHGTFAAPRLALRATAEPLTVGALRAARVRVDAQLAPQGRSEVRARLEELFAGMPLKELTVDGAGTRRAHRVTVAARGVDGVASLTLTGSESGGTFHGRLAEAAVQPPGEAAWHLEEPAAISYAAGRLHLEPACMTTSDSRACAELETAPGRQRIAFRTRGFELQHLKPWLPPEWSVGGTLTGTAALRLRGGELAEVRADLAGSAGFVEAAGVRLDYGPGALRVQPDEDRLHATVTLRPAGGEIAGDVWIAGGGLLLDRPMVGDLRVKLPDLAWLPVLSPEIAGAQGSVDGDLHVSGSLRGPALHGRLQVANGRVQLTTPGIELSQISASFERGRDAPLKTRIAAESGGGALALEGELRTLQPRLTGTFTLKGENAQGFNTAELRAWISPDLKLELDGLTARLTGVLGVPRAEITPRELDRGGVAPSNDAVIVREEDTPAEATLALESEVRIVLGDAVRFDGLGLKTRLTGAITTYDARNRPTHGRGELQLVGGRYKAYGQELQIETGRLIFAGGPVTNPAIDITAIRKPREDIKVGLRARGTLDAPEFNLFSEPAMSQEEQLSWLVLGRSLSATLDGGQRARLNDAALSLGLTGGQFVAQQLAPRLGVDEVSLGAKPGETADLARFTIGKYLSPKLFVSYGVGLFQPGHFFRMQYDLGKRFKLVGESGVQQGGDLLYTIER